MFADEIIVSVRDELGRNRAQAIDIVYRELNRVLLAGRLDEAADLLRAFAGSGLTLAVLLSAVVASHPWRASLTEPRALLAERVRALAAAEGEETARQVERFLR